MNTEQTLLKTQQQIKKYQSQGRRNRYPQCVKEDIAILSQKISGPQLARKLGISKSFIYRCSKKLDHNKTRKIIQKEETPIDHLRLEDITQQLKSFVKEKDQTISPSMRLTTASGIVVEIF